MSVVRGSTEFAAETEALVAQRLAHAGTGYRWADYEVRAISGDSHYMDDDARLTLGFSSQHFGMMDSLAVSCDICGGLFVERLAVMRQHRLRCGWGN